MGIRTYDVLSFPKQEDILVLWIKNDKKLKIQIKLVLQGGEDEPFTTEVEIEPLALFSDPVYRGKGRNHSVGIYGTVTDERFGTAKNGYIISIDYSLDRQEGTAETRAK